MIISMDTEKTFGKLQHAFTIKHLMKLGVEGIYLNTIMAIYNKPITIIILNGEKVKTFPQKVRNETRVSTSSTFIQHTLEILSQSNKIGRRKKRTSNRKGRSLTTHICR
jgi:hypothetical protein